MEMSDYGFSPFSVAYFKINKAGQVSPVFHC